MNNFREIVILNIGEMSVRKLKNGAFACYPKGGKINISQLEKQSLYKEFKNKILRS